MYLFILFIYFVRKKSDTSSLAALSPVVASVKPHNTNNRVKKKHAKTLAAFGDMDWIPTNKLNSKHDIS